MHHKNRLLKFFTAGVKKNKRKIIFIFLLFLVSGIITFSLFKSGFPVTDDGTWLIIRFSAFFETLKTGQFPVRFIYRLNDGMGYPVSNFLYPLYLYLATPIHILGFSFVNSIKILIIFNVFLSSLFTFLWLNKKFSDTSSFLGSTVLILSPYFLFDIYKRGSVGELLTFSIVPFILWQTERKSFIFLSIGFFFLVLAHNTLGFLFLIFILFYAFTNKSDLKLIFKSIILGLGLSAFFWIPALFDLPSTVFLGTKVSSFFDYLLKAKDYYIVGFSSVIILLVSILFVIQNKNKKDVFFMSSIILAVPIIFVQLPQSKIIWELFPFRDFIQFPFRLLSVLIFLLVFQAAYLYENIRRFKHVFVSLILISLFLQALIFLKNIEFQYYEEGFYSTNQSTTTVADEYQNKWFKKPDAGSEKIQVVEGIGSIESSQITPGKMNFSSDFETNGQIQINLAYFPEWKAKIDDNEALIEYTKNGLLNLSILEGRHSVEVIYQQSVIHKFSNIISIISFIILIYFSLTMLKKRSLRYNLK